MNNKRRKSIISSSNFSPFLFVIFVRVLCVSACIFVSIYSLFRFFSFGLTTIFSFLLSVGSLLRTFFYFLILVIKKLAGWRESKNDENKDCKKKERGQMNGYFYNFFSSAKCSSSSTSDKNGIMHIAFCKLFAHSHFLM